MSEKDQLKGVFYLLCVWIGIGTVLHYLLDIGGGLSMLFSTLFIGIAIIIINPKKN